MLPLLIGLALLFDFLNGMHDSSNIVATMISSRSIRPGTALTLTALAEFCGPFLFGVAVARTIGSEVVLPTAVDTSVLLAAVGSAICWNLITWLVGIPSSSSHALIGGLLGAVIANSGWTAIQVSGLSKILLTLFLSPIFGFFAGWLITGVVFHLAVNASPRINLFFKRAQLVTAIALALSHGTNDAQKTMGIITMALVINRFQSSFQVPIWVVALSAGAIALGTLTGGWRLIRTLGSKFYRIRTVDAFCAQTASAGVILGASLFGGPVSTTQVVSSSIVGAGAADRPNKVRWNTAGQIILAWLVTIPVNTLAAAGILLLIRSIR